MKSSEFYALPHDAPVLRKNPYLFPIFFQLVIALLSILAISAAHAHSGHHAHKPVGMMAKGGDFILTSANGPVALKDFRGKVVAIYFGYSHCTDICPVDLGRLGDALRASKPKDLARIRPIFITVDPARDDANRMAAYSASFHPKLIGLTGSGDEIAAVAKAYGVSYEKGPVDAAGNYDIEHPSTIFIVGQSGKLLRSLPKGSNPSSIAAALRKALRNND